MRKETKYAIIIAAGTAIVLLGIWFSFGELNPFYVVASGSMIPNLNINDYVIVSHNVSFNSLKVGDIIVFKTYGTDDSGQHITIVHRVAEIVTDPINGQKIIRTKGDANPDSIPGADYPIFEKNYNVKLKSKLNGLILDITCCIPGKHGPLVSISNSHLLTLKSAERIIGVYCRMNRGLAKISK